MPPPVLPPTWEGTMPAAGLRFHVVRYDPPAPEAGRAPVLLLHGFPQTHYCWRHVAGPLARRTGRAVYAVDTKGNGASDRPRPTGRTPLGRYDVTRQVEELLALLDALGIEQIAVVGHDWGGVLAYLLAATAPARVEHLVLIDGPTTLARNPLRFAYAVAYQIPRLPEWIFRHGGLPLLRAGLRLYQAGRAPVFTVADAATYYAPLAAPGGIEAALAVYRSWPRTFPAVARARRRPPQMPVLLIWGDRDRALPLDVPRRMLREIPGGALAILRDTGHWVPEERPTAVVRLLTEFLEGAPAAALGRLAWTER